MLAIEESILNLACGEGAEGLVRALKVVKDKHRPRLVLESTLPLGTSLSEDFHNIANLLEDSEPCAVLVRLKDTLGTVLATSSDCVLIRWIPATTAQSPKSSTVFPQKEWLESAERIMEHLPTTRIREMLVSHRAELTLETFLGHARKVTGGPDHPEEKDARTIFITGASSNIGQVVAKHFQRRGWNVVATMRDPLKSQLTALSNVLVHKLDVTDASSLEPAVSAAIERFGKIDVLLNNAGYATWGPLECTSMEKVRQEFGTNVLGLLAMTKAVLPHMRSRGCGVIVNMSGICGQLTFPLGSVYHGSKFAVEGLSESLHYELEPLGISVKIVQPAVVRVEGDRRSIDLSMPSTEEEKETYMSTMEKMGEYWDSLSQEATTPKEVCEVIHTAATDGSRLLWYRAAAPSLKLWDDRQRLGDVAFVEKMRRDVGLSDV